MYYLSGQPPSDEHAPFPLTHREPRHYQKEKKVYLTRVRLGLIPNSKELAPPLILLPLSPRQIGKVLIPAVKLLLADTTTMLDLIPPLKKNDRNAMLKIAAVEINTSC